MKEKVNLLQWMLEDIRKETINGVSSLTKDQLFALPEIGEYPVGAYLMHLCECDLHWLEVISGEKQSEELKTKCYSDTWFDPSGESSPPTEAPELIEYASLLRETRQKFLGYISSLDDSELESSVIIKRKSGEVSLSKKWIVYHIIEHEAHHRGQMFLLMRRAGWKSDHRNNDKMIGWWLNPEQENIT